MSLPQLQNPTQLPPPQKPNIALVALKWLWRGFLVFTLICAIIAGFMGNMALFWLVAVLGLPTLWLERKWMTRTKIIATTIFSAFFIGFGIFSVTPHGRAVNAFTTREGERQRKRDALDKRVAEKAAAKQQAQDARRQAQQRAEDTRRQARQQAEEDRKDAQRQADEAAKQAQEAQAAQESETVKIDAYITAQEVVSKQLKSPSSAIYPNYQASFVQRTGDNTYQVSAYVDSQNSFGAMLRAQWTLVLHKDGDGGWSSKNVIVSQQ